jgi:hypothetical protein
MDAIMSMVSKFGGIWQKPADSVRFGPNFQNWIKFDKNQQIRPPLNFLRAPNF